MKKWSVRAGIIILVYGSIHFLKPSDNHDWFDVFGMSIMVMLIVTVNSWFISLFGLKKWFWRILDIILAITVVGYSIGSFL